MDLQAVSAAASIAIACAIVFLVAARAWQRLARLFTGHPDFAEHIMSEAAQRFRVRLRELTTRQSTWLGAGLVFVVMYTAASLFQGPQLFVGYPEWQLWVFLAALSGAAAFALYRILRTVIERRSVRFVRDANIAVGHQLQRIAAEHGRAYHDVPTAAGVIDHVLLGHNGVYAVNVIARRPRKNGEVSLHEHELQFSGKGAPVSIVDLSAATKQLSKSLTKLVGHKVRVRSVIAVPGWEISAQPLADHLLVNERNLPMLRGWKDRSDYLMAEDVDELQAFLSAECRGTVS